MDATLKCPKCSAHIPLTDAFRKEIEAEVLAEEHARHAKELDEARTAAASAAAKKAEADSASREAALRVEAQEEKERSGKLLKQLEELTGEMRTLKRKDEERELEYKQQLAADEDCIRTETRKSVADEFLLKDREKDKRLADALRQVEELKAKMQQGSQQTQGEVLELELEESLRREFKDDEITEVKKGERTARWRCTPEGERSARALLRNDPLGNEECPLDGDLDPKDSGRPTGSESSDCGPRGCATTF